MKKRNFDIKKGLNQEISLSAIEDGIKSNIHRQYNLWMMFMIFGILGLRIAGTFYTGSIDYFPFLSRWVKAYSVMGWKEALASHVTNYYVPYNIILIVISRFHVPPYIGISLVSCLADLCIAYYLYRILQCYQRAPKKHLFIVLSVLLLPVCVIDSAFWKQCDSVYAMFAVISLYYYITGHYTKCFVVYAIGFCFKLQIIFLLPLYGMLWLFEHKHSFLQFLWIPLLYGLTGLPSILAGDSWSYVYRTYMSQVNLSRDTFLNYPNIWAVLPELSGDPVVRVAEGITIVVLVIFLTMCLKKKHVITALEMLCLAGITVWTCAMFLTCMHERYDYLSLIILWVYGLAKGKYEFRLSVVMQCIMTICYTSLINYFPYPLLGMVYICVYIAYVCRGKKECREHTDKEAG